MRITIKIKYRKGVQNLKKKNYKGIAITTYNNLLNLEKGK